MQRQKHEWKVETDEGTRLYRAVHHAKEWVFFTGMKGSRREKTELEKMEEVDEDVWVMLRNVLFRKYQRRRCSWKLIEQIDKRLGREPEDYEE
ncbi:hypothetical protein SAMN02745181_0829 [Rubritalea squalenifaciens DSM 18772]|uniref:Uncharacterized protein n=2 Tax=Rubritalea TaxID=361050 RepID=A0A1M6DTQ9_9BACT|nr:hypothetical protein [Rubritalea squalenifaciens]SHI76520.1 hypothetical protein SAMN02745181_0829 [Rubritalea squalenifaciens DSM 18772]